MTQERWKQATILLILLLLVLAFITWAWVSSASVRLVTLCWVVLILGPLVCISGFFAIRSGGDGLTTRAPPGRRIAAGAISAVGVALYALGFAVWPHLGDRAYLVFANGAAATAIASVLAPSRRAPFFALSIAVVLMFILFAKGV